MFVSADNELGFASNCAFQKLIIMRIFADRTLQSLRHNQFSMCNKQINNLANIDA
jgi:hypothetical protein